MTRSEPRRPRVFAADDPGLTVSTAAPPGRDPSESPTPRDDGTGKAEDSTGEARPTAGDRRRGFGWGSLLVSALSGLFFLGLGAWFARLVSAALAREDLIGWTAYGLLIIAGVSALVLLIREAIGFSRLKRLARLKSDVARAIAAEDTAAEREAVRRIQALYSHREDLRWGLARFREHEQDVHDAGGLLALADRELVAPLDGEARRTILTSARRVSVVTAISPVFVLAILYVLVENVRMLRGLATLYGGRPGVLGALRLGRLVIGHIIATGGLALTDDLVGQFLGQDLVRRLSRRLGEGVFNGALTARIGVAAIEVCRPLPFLDASPIRVRDLVGEVVRSLRRGEEKSGADARRSERIDR